MALKEVARGRWGEIFENFGLPPITGKKHFSGPCPICGKKKKFRIDDRGGLGTWICVCGSGDGINLVMETQGMPFNEVSERIHKLFGIPIDYDTQNTAVMEDNRNEEAIKYFKKLLPVKNSQVETYLNSRNIQMLPDKGVKFSPMEFSGLGQPEAPAMVSYVSTNNNKVLYRHCTYLFNGQKMNLEESKKIFTVIESEQSCAVRMFSHGDVLGISEGIETALSAAQLYGVPTWATVNSAFMKRFRAPKGVEHLLIFADNDKNGTGLEAAFTCGRKNILIANDVKKVTIMWPDIYETDFNDYLKNSSGKILEWKLIK